MQPRTKKGPSWKDDDPLPTTGSSTSTDRTGETSTKKKSQKLKHLDQEEKREGADVPTPEVTEPMSDLDWLRRHTKATVDVDMAPEKDFEQSDDDESSDDDEDWRGVSGESNAFLSILCALCPASRNGTHRFMGGMHVMINLNRDIRLVREDADP